MDKAILPQVADDFNALAAAHGWETICDASLAFEKPELVALKSTWDQVTATCPLPSRQQMTPRILKDWLPHIAFCERIQPPDAPRRYRIRLLGTAYQPVWGDLTGRFLDEAVPPGHEPRLATVLDTVLGHGGPFRILTRSVITDRTYLVAEFFMAALADSNREANIVLSAGYFSHANWGEIARVYWGKKRASRS